MSELRVNEGSPMKLRYSVDQHIKIEKKSDLFQKSFKHIDASDFDDLD